MAFARPVLCRLCGFPAPDGGVPVSEVDREKLSEWCLRTMDTELDEEGLNEAVVCNVCLWQAKFLEENHDLSEKSRLPIWWKRRDILREAEFPYNYLLDDVIQPCAVTIPVMSKELLQRQGLLSDTTLTQQQPRKEGRALISNCIYCSVQFATKMAMIRHVKTEHNSNSTFRCYTCNLFFLSSQEKVTHHKKFHSRVYLKCPHCSHHFTSLSSLSHHVAVVHKRTLICCPYRCCTAYFANEKMRLQHCQEVHETEETIKCIYCDKHFLRNMITWHTKKHHNSIYIKCNFVANCTSFFHTEEERKKHILKVHESGFDRIVCIYCQRRVLKLKMNDHVKKNHGKERIKCHYYRCVAYFHTMEDKQNHILEVHESYENHYRCIYCNLVVNKRKGGVINHMRTHKKEAIKCDYQFHCPNYFLTHEDKQKHILEVHEAGEDKIRCKYCAKMVQIKGIVDHIRIHHLSETKKGAEVERVKCIYCEREMKKLYLVSHMKGKHKTEAIKCNFNKNCCTFFWTVEDRQKHIAEVHMVGKKVSDNRCFICNKIYNYTEALRYHIKTAHPESFECEKRNCCKYFLTKQKR